MREKILFSILIPSIPERLDQLKKLINKIEKQIDGDPFVEVISFIDNKKISIGEKRNMLVQLANGKFLAFVDDDDDVSDDYVSEIMSSILKSPDADVIMINSLAILNGKKFNIVVDIDYPNEEIQSDSNGNFLDCKRKPFHVCAWRSDIAKSENFPNVGYGEDWNWCERLIPKVEKSVKIDKQLYIYIFDNKKSAAPTESNEIWTNPNKK
jgi:glycosyltransferase involved in cell wall biosynthesis